MPLRALPLTPEMLLSFAGQLLKWGWKEFSYVILVAFSCFLRTGEMFRLRRQHIRLPTKIGQPAIVFLEDTKGGQRKQISWEKVLVKEVLALECLRALCCRRQGPDLLVQTSIYQFRKVWKDVVAHFHLSHLAIQPYSIRRGGATSSYKNGTSFKGVVSIWTKPYKSLALCLSPPPHPVPYSLLGSIFIAVSQEGARERGNGWGLTLDQGGHEMCGCLDGSITAAYDKRHRLGKKNGVCLSEPVIFSGPGEHTR